MTEKNTSPYIQAAPAGEVPPFSGAAPRQTRLLGWGLFARTLSLQAGTLFLLAGIICFFAYNWADIPAFGKFGLIAGGMIATAAAAFFRGMHSTAGSLCLLACGLLAGPLLAVYGQVYQTGADAWELFRAWTLFLAPLALIGRRNGLWCALWLVGSLWAILFMQQNMYALDREGEAMRMLLYISLGQSVFFVAWELAARYLAGPGLSFLYGRWFPRLVGLALIGYLGLTLMTHIVDRHGDYPYTLAYGALYGFFLGAGAFWYTRARHDLFLIACGLLSLIGVVMALLHRADPSFRSTGWLFIMTLALIGCAAAAGKTLIFLHKRMRAEESAERRPPGEERAGGDENAPAAPFSPAGSLRSFSLERLRFILTGTAPAAARDEAGTHEERAAHASHTPHAPHSPHAPHAPWTARILMGICAWIAVPFILGLIVLLFADALDTGGMLVVALVLLGLGLALSRAPGIFVQQASLCLCLTGAIAAGALAALEWNLKTFVFLPAIAIFAATAPLAGSAAYRFIAATAAIALAPLQADLYFGGLYSYRHASFEPAAGAGLFPPPLILFASGYVAFSLALAFVWFRRENLAPLARTARDAGFAALLIFGLLPLFFYKGNLFGWAGMYGGPFHMIGPGAGIGLCTFAWRTAKELGASVPVRYGLLFFCLLFTVASFRLPWLTPGLFALALARHRGSLPLLGTAIVFLAGSTVFEYYCLATSLLSKSCSLGGIGAVLLAGGCWLQRRLAAAERGFSAEEVSGSSDAEDASRRAGASRPGAWRMHAGRAAPALCLAVFLALFALAVRDKEVLLAEGNTVILALRPLDPRSLMQGDYMTLDLAVERDISRALDRNADSDPENALPVKGVAVLEPGAEGVFRFVGIEGLSANAPDAARGQVRILYRGKSSHMVRIASGSFFFQEGHGRAYERARFAELKVDADGNSLVTHLLDEQRQRIQPEKKPSGE